MMRQRKNYVLLLIVAIATVGTVAIAYAAMSQVLNVTSNKVSVTAVPDPCAIGFTAGTVTATTGGTSGTGRSCGSATVTANTVTVGDISLLKPDEYFDYFDLF